MGTHTDNTGNTSTHTEIDPLLPKADVHRKEIIWKQYLAAFMASVVSLGTGCVGGWSASATPKLLDGSSELGISPLTIEQVSWVGSLINLGAFFGSIPAGYLSFLVGRKVSLLLLAWPIIIGWLFVLFNQNNVWFLYIGRFISGISYGSMNVALPMYNNEICADRIRGRVGTMYDLLQCVGILYVYFISAISTLFWTTIFSLLIPVIFLFTFIWMPESPLYLVRTGKKDEAIRSIKWLYGEDCDVSFQLQRIHHALLEGKNNNTAGPSNKETDHFSPTSSFKIFGQHLSKVTIKAVLLAFFMFVVQRTCGATMVQYYGDSIFEMANSSISPSYATVLIGIISVVGSLVSIIAVDTLGRRLLLTFSFFIMAVSLAIFVAYLALIVENSDPFINSLAIREYYGLIPSITLCVFIAMFRLGVSPVPWFMAPEIIPTEAQKWAPSTIVCITWGTSFILSKCFLPAMEAFGQVPVFSFFLAVNIIGFLYTWLFIPETKNKSRDEIQRELGATISDDTSDSILVI